tara:strand:- start:59 stop:355 length:297 start_codon:yes stop_codon:yes gene_type:complete
MTQSKNNYDFGKLAKKCTTDKQKIIFFDRYQAAFFPDISDVNFSSKKNASKDIDDAFHVYANMKRMTEDELDELWKLTWIDYPENFKIFLFDFCFLNY